MRVSCITKRHTDGMGSSQNGLFLIDRVNKMITNTRPENGLVMGLAGSTWSPNDLRGEVTDASHTRPHASVAYILEKGSFCSHHSRLSYSYILFNLRLFL